MLVGRILGIALSLCLLLSYNAFSAIIPVTFDGFYADPSVVVSADGLSAVMSEDEDLSAVFLANDPSFGEPGIAVPENLLSFEFYLDFTLGDGNDDTFLATLFDGDTGAFIDDFYLDSTWQGLVSWNLSALDPAITLFGLEFQLSAFDLLIDSTATISNMLFRTADLHTEDPAPVPEPGTLLLMGAGMVGLLLYRRKRVN